MSWNPVRRLPDVQLDAHVLGADGWLFFREACSLRAFAPEAATSSWCFEDQTCGLWGSRCTILTEGLIITVMAPGRGAPTRIVALESVSGRVVWEHSIALKLGVGSMAATGGLVRIVGTDGQGRSWLVTLEVRSGKERSRTPSPWAHMLVPILGKLFFVGGPTVSVLSAGAETPRQFLEVEACFPSSDTRSLYFSRKTPGPLQVVRLDAESEQPLHIREAPPEVTTISQIVPLDAAGHVALVSDGLGPGTPTPVLMDLTSDEPPRRVELRPGSWISRGILAGPALVLLHRAKDWSEVTLHDPLTGRALRDLGVRSHTPMGVFSSDGSLVVVGDGALVFREDSPGDPQMLDPGASLPPVQAPAPVDSQARTLEEHAELAQRFDLLAIRDVEATSSAASQRGASGGPRTQAGVGQKGLSMPDAELRRCHEATGPGPRSSPRLRWKLDFAAPLHAGPVLTEGVLVVVTENKVIGVDVQAGSALWSVKLTGRILASPGWAEDVAFVGEDSGHVHAIEARTGKVRWRAATGPVYVSPVVSRGLVLLSAYRQGGLALHAGTGERVWQFKSGNQTSGASVVGDRVYFASSGTLHTRDLWTGKEISKVRPPELGVTRTGLVIQGNRAVIGTQKKGVVAIDLETSTVVWTHPCRRMVLHEPALAGNRVFAGPDSEELRALDASSGVELWRSRERAVASPRVGGDSVFLGTDHGLRCLDAATGALLWDYPVRGAVATPWLEGGVVYAATYRGDLLALS